MKTHPFWNTISKSFKAMPASFRRVAAHVQLRFFQTGLASPLLIGSVALLFLMADPAFAQSIDLSPIQNLLQGIVDALTGPLGVVIATLAVLGVFLSWFFNIIDLRQALWVLVGIAGVAAAPTIVSAVFGG